MTHRISKLQLLTLKNYQPAVQADLILCFMVLNPQQLSKEQKKKPLINKPRAEPIFSIPSFDRCSRLINGFYLQIEGRKSN
jgi:hypothetical protein